VLDYLDPWMVAIKILESENKKKFTEKHYEISLINKVTLSIALATEWNEGFPFSLKP
jgi:hypothetical protein